MLPELKYFPVNWVDGMKINQDHFRQLELSLIDRARDASGSVLNDYTFGILSPESGNEKSLDIKISIDQSKLITATLRKCRAITRSGARIEINPSIAKTLNLPSSDVQASFDANEHKAKSFYVVVRVNPYKQMPAGQPEKDEVPGRIPFTIPYYDIEILPADQVIYDTIPDYFIPVGRIVAANNRLLVDSQYIPPATSCTTIEQLNDYYYNMGNMLGEISKYLINIIQKIKSKSQSSSLTTNFSFMAEKVVFFTANEIGRYRWIIGGQSPVHMMEYFIRFAYIMKTSLDCLVDRDKEELISYMSEWSEGNTAQFESVIMDVIRCEYNHMDISASLLPAERMIALFHGLFAKLSQLDFIGKRKGEGTFVRERVVEEEQPKPEEKPRKKGFSFLTDDPK
jgi:hypothetical protein